MEYFGIYNLVKKENMPCKKELGWVQEVILSCSPILLCCLIFRVKKELQDKETQC